MLNQTYGNAKYISAAEATCITSANAFIIGILFQASATADIQIWAGTTATATSNGVALSGKIRGYGTTGSATAQTALWYPFPAYASGGICINVAGAGDPSLTLFWNPAGGA